MVSDVLLNREILGEAWFMSIGGKITYKAVVWGSHIKSITQQWTTSTSSTLYCRTGQSVAHGAVYSMNGLVLLPCWDSVGCQGLCLQIHFSSKSMAISSRATLSPSPHKGAEQMSGLNLPPLSLVTHIHMYCDCQPWEHVRAIIQPAPHLLWPFRSTSHLSNLLWMFLTRAFQYTDDVRGKKE